MVGMEEDSVYYDKHIIIEVKLYRKKSISKESMRSVGI